MEIIESTEERAQVIMSREELLIVNAALNEVCNGIAVFEFETRIGAERRRVVMLLDEMGALLDQMTPTKG